MHKRFRLFPFLFILALAVLLTTAALADPAADITNRCKFFAGSRRTTFSQCRDRNYKPYWQSANGDSAYIEVTAQKTAYG